MLCGHDPYEAPSLAWSVPSSTDDKEITLRLVTHTAPINVKLGQAQDVINATFFSLHLRDDIEFEKTNGMIQLIRPQLPCEAAQSKPKKSKRGPLNERILSLLGATVEKTRKRAAPKSSTITSNNSAKISKKDASAAIDAYGHYSFLMANARVSSGGDNSDIAFV